MNYLLVTTWSSSSDVQGITETTALSTKSVSYSSKLSYHKISWRSSNRLLSTLSVPRFLNPLPSSLDSCSRLIYRADQASLASHRRRRASTNRATAGLPTTEGPTSSISTGRRCALAAVGVRPWSGGAKLAMPIAPHWGGMGRRMGIGCRTWPAQ